MTTEFMLNLLRTLTTDKKVAESTANAYVKTLQILNGKVGFKNLTFLKKTEEVMKKIDEYAESTQKAIFATITSVLSLYKDKPTYKKVYDFYYGKMMEKSKEAREAPTNEKSEKQKDNWISWEDVEKRKTELKAEVDAFGKTLTPTQYDTLLRYVVLSLYTDIQPRRNQDYLDMFVIRKMTRESPTDRNYYDLATQKFIFNKYKTAKSYGAQIVEVPTALQEALSIYIRHHPLWVASKKKSVEFKLLVGADGKPLTAVNAITRILNRIFGKKVGSSMLRSIYLSDKYKDTNLEMKKDAEAMGHSVGEQQNVYVKTD
ncbi:MAG: hypothetical protein YSLV5_ORF15 [Yellowstone Lake virophage 5]|uniref:Uncharacterized protein n=1 Tax=Yellowstone Lake virophage 5 TaxID=1557033 RepID=A0A0A0RK55_9VIRU|nr:MAG: hypothetical protein ASQ69_gp15 [Yellowstone Lake virophage 5]AIW01873.1 MAG: hypothetical protein YSLV5_ORF15 [Yellowstone Lake virophage 5]